MQMYSLQQIHIFGININVGWTWTQQKWEWKKYWLAKISRLIKTFLSQYWLLLTAVKFLYLNLNKIQQNHNFCKGIYLYAIKDKNVTASVETESAIISTSSFQLEAATRNSDWSNLKLPQRCLWYRIKQWQCVKWCIEETSSPHT